MTHCPFNLSQSAARVTVLNDISHPTQPIGLCTVSWAITADQFTADHQPPTSNRRPFNNRPSPPTARVAVAYDISHPTQPIRLCTVSPVGSPPGDHRRPFNNRPSPPTARVAVACDIFQPTQPIRLCTVSPVGSPPGDCHHRATTTGRPPPGDYLPSPSGFALLARSVHRRAIVTAGRPPPAAHHRPPTTRPPTTKPYS